MPIKNTRILLTIIVLFISSLAQAVSSGSSSLADGSGYLPLKPAFVVNIRDGNRSRFLQVEIQLKLSNMEQSEKILHHDSIIRHTILMSLSHQDARDLYSSTGKNRLRIKLLNKIRTALKSEFTTLTIADLYFTTFIIQ